TGGTATIEVMNRTPQANLEEFERGAAKLPDYEIVVHGEGRPRLPPLLIDCDGPYFVGVTCYVSSILRSTSDSHEEAAGDRRFAPYGKSFESSDMTGVFCDPRTGQTIEIPDAGAARFWIEFELGKFLFPEIAGANLDVLNSEVVAAADKCFGVRFVQG